MLSALTICEIAGEWWGPRVLQLVSTHNFGEQGIFAKKSFLQSESVKVSLLKSTKISLSMFLVWQCIFSRRQHTNTHANAKLLSAENSIKIIQYGDKLCFHVFNTVFYFAVLSLLSISTYPEMQNWHCPMLRINSCNRGMDGNVPSNLPFRCFDTLLIFFWKNLDFSRAF